MENYVRAFDVREQVGSFTGSEARDMQVVKVMAEARGTGDYASILAPRKPEEFE